MNWLNVFTAYRAAQNQERANQTQNYLNKVNGNPEGVDAEAVQQSQIRGHQDQILGNQEQRAQEDHDTARGTQLVTGALGAFDNMRQSIEASDLPEDQRPQAFAAAWDRIAPALQAAGYDPAKIDGLRAQIIENPASAGDIASALQTGGGSRQGLQPAFDAQGNAVFIDPRTGRPAARGYAPATAVLGNKRVGISQQNADTANGRLTQQQITNDPDHVRQVSAARTTGNAQGTVAANLPQIEEQFAELDDRADQVLGDPALKDVTGFPTVGGVFRGGFGGIAAPVPGSGPANALARAHALGSQIRLLAFNAMKGSGQITEAESEFGAAAQANLDRAQSAEQLRNEIDRLRLTAHRRLAALRRTAGAATTPAPSDAASAPTTPAPAPSPAHAQNPTARRDGETTDQYLSRLGL